MSDEQFFEKLSRSYDINIVIILESLKVVKKFIKDNDLILYGGQAIDSALRKKGSHLYNENSIPDYDFYSPNNVNHSYELANILVDLGYENVSVIRRMHVQTMAVRIDFINIADISFVPKTIFDKLPVIKFDEMNVIDPLYQKIDMHLALAFPFKGPPKENIFNRWKKDIDRFNMLSKFYPLKVDNVKISKTKTEVKMDYDGQYVFFGMFAYGQLYNFYKNTSQDCSGIIDLQSSFSDGVANFEIPTGTKPVLEVLSIDKLQIPGEWYHPFLDVLPKKIKQKMVEIYDMSTQYITVHNGIINCQYLMAYLLINYFVECNDVYLKLYASLMKMTYNIGNMVDSPFSLSINTIGSENYDEIYFISKNNSMYEMGLEQIIDGLPQNYFPNNVKVKTETFQYKNNYFKRDGSKI
jgi:hypothetical protein